MGFYREKEKHVDNFFEVVSIHKSLSQQNFYSKISVLMFFNVFEFIQRKI